MEEEKVRVGDPKDTKGPKDIPSTVETERVSKSKGPELDRGVTE